VRAETAVLRYWRAASVPVLLTLAFLLSASLHAAPGWQALASHRWTPLAPAPPHAPGFTRLPAVGLGITFTNVLSDDRSITNRNLLSGSGLALGDVDGDGWCDVYLCGLDSDNRLYRNRGNWKFEDITGSTGLACPNLDATGSAFADVDGDGDLDLLVNILGGGTRLFRNDGRGQFIDGTTVAGLGSASGATSLALADVDGDGDLDLYVANFRPSTILDRPTARFSLQNVDGRPRVAAVDGRPVTEPDLKDRFQIGDDGQVQEYGEPDVLWINDGKGHFEAISWTGGAFVDEEGKPLTAAPRDWGLAVRFHDVDRDGDPDLYVCNDLWTPDRFWINESRDGRVRFRAIGHREMRNNPTFSMGVDFGDLDLDSNEDFYAVDMLSRSRRHRQTQLAAMAPEMRPPGLILDRVQMKRNVLQMGRADGSFGEAAHQAGIEASEWSWGPVFLDVDLDGFEDILVGNGQHRDFQDSDGAERIAEAQRGGRALSPARIQELVRSFPRLVTDKLLFRNRGDATFEEVGRAWGFGDASISQGLALADLDNDGDLDVVVNQLFDAPGFYRNESGAPRLAVELRGPKGNTAGIGARIVVHPAPGKAALPPVQSRQIIAGGRYLAGDQPRRSFALGSATMASIEVHWPGGRVSQVTNAVPGRLYEVSAEVTAPEVARPVVKPLFEDVSARLGHGSTEEPFDDFQRQPLLPNRLSLLGPGVTWTDLNGDGRDDLLIGTGKGGMIGAFIGRPDGSFEKLDRPPFNKVAGRDLTTLIPLGGVILVGSANYEDGLTNGGCLRVLDLARGVSGETVLAPAFSTGPVAAADLDGDGQLELFVGGRLIAGRYPEPATSLVLRTAGGRIGIQQRIERLGLVSGACFSDLDGDGDPDLIVAREWASIGFFRNDKGNLVEWKLPIHSGERVLEDRELSGLWNAVVAGDFDGDGRMDLVASNWGRNTAFRASSKEPRRLYFGDLGSGGVDLFEASVEAGSGRQWPCRELPVLRMILPNLAEKFATHAAYAEADLGQVLGDFLPRLGRLEVTQLDSVVLLNRGDHLELRPLPALAQRAPAFGLCVADCDGDGHEDVFLAQNWFSAQPMMQRNDGGRGLWLRGDGRGGFTADDMTGVAVFGEGRGAAVADFDSDGRVDLVVTQNAAATTLWHNVGAKPGLRIRLAGPAGNPTAAGARIRVLYGDRAGPTREIHLGSGYWSVDSAVSVLGLDGEPTAVEVIWPGGQKKREPIPSGAREVTVGMKP
jgi:hypothetical protein